MKQRKSKIQAMLCFVIICQLLGMTQSIGSPVNMQLLSPEKQSFNQNDIRAQSTFNETSDILQMITRVNTSKLKEYVQNIQDFGPHPTGSDNCKAVGTYLFDTLNSFNLTVRYDHWKYKLRSGNNIEAILQGMNRSNSTIIISAHYDSVSISPGANDDGSGVAVVLATAEILSQYRFNSTIRFVLFSGEEQGLLGSHEYVQSAVQNGEHILGNLNLDGIGYAITAEDGKKMHHISNNQSAWMVDISSMIASQYQEAIGLEVIRLSYINFGDHDSFVQNDYDASDFWEYRLTPYYHTSEDTLEHMNMTYLTKVCKLAVGTLAFIATLHPYLTRNDIQISLKGSVLSYPSQFYVRVENKKPYLGSANVTINIQMRNLRTNQYVVMEMNSNNLACNWTFTKEITNVWEFKILGRQYLNQLISLQVIMKGINDDFPMYITQQTIGVIVGKSVFLIPKE